MKKYKDWLVIAFFTFQCFYGYDPKCHAQQKLDINDTVSDSLINQILNLVNTEKNTWEQKRYDGVIVNFWATWCAPCIEELKFLNTVIPRYSGLKVVSVTYESQEVVKQFLDRQSRDDFKNLTIVDSDTALKKIFPHNALPHDVWINSENIIVAISGGKDLTEDNIRSFLAGEQFKFIERKQSSFSYMVPMSVPDSAIQYRSFFHPYREEISFNGMMQDNPKKLKKPSMTRFYGWNVTALQLFWKAYQKGAVYNPYLGEVYTKDSLRLFYPEELDSTIFANSRYADSWPKGWTVRDINWRSSRVKWQRDNLYSYELIYKNANSDSLFYDKVIRELEFNLNMKTYIKMREKNCIEVTISDKGKEIVKALPYTEDKDYSNIIVNSKDGRYVLSILNSNIDELIEWLRLNTYGWKLDSERKEPYVNNTNLDKRFSTSIELGTDKWRDVHFLESVLSEKLGFEFHEKPLEYPVLVIEDMN